ncbi:MAG: hypothetical protein ABI867_19965 [Kofleriaceae bacterium]
MHDPDEKPVSHEGEPRACRRDAPILRHHPRRRRMHNKWLACLALATSFGAIGCSPDIEVDENEGLPGPTVEFDPANKIIPFPNNLLLDPATGKLNLPASCGPAGGLESPTAQALREGVLNKLDGFGVFKTTLNVTFTEDVDVASLEGHVFLYKITADPAMSTAIPVVFVPGQAAHFDATCTTPTVVPQITIVPAVPLEGKSTYVVGITQGVKTATGTEFLPSFVWGIVRSAARPVTLDDAGNIIADLTPLDPADDADKAQLLGINQLWEAHEKPLQFLAAKGQPQATLLLGWSFNTQTVTQQLDPTVATSPAGLAAATTALTAVDRRNPAATGAQFMVGALGANCEPPGGVGPIPCNSVGEALVGKLAAKQFQVDTTNPFDATTPIPGPWNDPITPAVVKTADLDAFITTPTVCPTEGCPTVIFGHGLGSSKSTVYAIAAQLARAGFNAVAIDFVAHDTRAIRVSNAAAALCADDPASTRPDHGPSPTVQPQCYAPFLSPNLGATRDNIRQSVIDLHSLFAAVKACGVAGCAGARPFSVDPTKILYMGISLGGIMGSTATATQPDFKAAALNVPGVGWVDILENTQSLAIRCSLVNGLIDAGIVTGDKAPSPTALCLGEEWKTQPGYKQFAVIGRWILDPADGVNFTSKLATRKILIQEVVGDQVVANVTTETEAALVGLVGATGDMVVSATPAPSAAITTDPTANKFVRYPTLPPSGPFPGNTFQHASLLSPALSVSGGTCNPATGASCDGVFGTIRLQTDAITFLVLNK